MHQTVQVAGALLDLLAHVVVDLHVEDVGHQVQSILVVVHLRVKAGEVEAVCEVVFVDLAEVFVASCCYELRGVCQPDHLLWLCFLLEGCLGAEWHI
jgi:hypothetical protein